MKGMSLILERQKTKPCNNRSPSLATGAGGTAAAPACYGQAGSAADAAEQGAGRAQGTACGGPAGCVQPQGAEDGCGELVGRLRDYSVHAQLGSRCTLPSILCQPEQMSQTQERRSGSPSEVNAKSSTNTRQRQRFLHGRPQVHEAPQNKLLYTDPAVTGRSHHVHLAHSSGGGRCVGSRPKRFFKITRSLENLSSGEKRAGCAECVGVPSGAVFCA
jgi:hypothetical protein